MVGEIFFYASTSLLILELHENRIKVQTRLATSETRTNNQLLFVLLLRKVKEKRREEAEEKSRWANRTRNEIVGFLRDEGHKKKQFAVFTSNSLRLETAKRLNFSPSTHRRGRFKFSKRLESREQELCRKCLQVIRKCYVCFSKQAASEIKEKKTRKMFRSLFCCAFDEHSSMIPLT